MKRSASESRTWSVLGLWVLGVWGCTVTPGGEGVHEPNPVPEEIAECQVSPPPPLGSGLMLGGQSYSLTWEDDFGGPLGGGQARSFLNKDFWTKENLGVNLEQQAYTNRECPDHPKDWNYCVENGRLTLLARQEKLDCVAWKKCASTPECGSGGECAATGSCVYDQNKNGVWDHEECAPFDGISLGDGAPVNGRTFTSGRLKSDNKVEHRYGYVEFRARMPFAELPAGTRPPNGMWPAIWMLGADSAIVNGGRSDSAGWPMVGEVDIMEYTQIRENKALFPDNGAMGANVIWRERPETGEAAARTGGREPNACSDWPNRGDAKCDGDVSGARSIWNGLTVDYHQWHTWGFLWDDTGFKLYLDNLPQKGGTPVASYTIGEGATEFRQPMYLILNNAVGGTLGCLGWDSRACTTSAQCANAAACVSGRCQETPSSCVDVDWATQGDKAGLEVDYVRWFHRDSGYSMPPAASCQDGDGDITPDNLVHNCGFNEDFTAHRSDLFFEGGSGITDIVNEGDAHGYSQWVRVEDSGTKDHCVQVRQEGIPLQSGVAYTWKVDLKASAARPVVIKVAQSHEPWNTVASFTCAVGTAWTACAPPDFTAPAADLYKLEIDLGTHEGTKFNGSQVFVDNLYLGTVARSCQPDCTGKRCGNDGCGGSCGTCGAGTVCGDWNACVAPASTSRRPVRLEAERATLTGCQVEPGGDSGGKVTGLEVGDSLCWSGVDLTGITSVTAHLGSPRAQGRAALRFNDASLCALDLDTSTGGWSGTGFNDMSIAVSSPGIGTLCLVGVDSSGGQLFSVDYLELR